MNASVCRFQLNLTGTVKRGQHHKAVLSFIFILTNATFFLCEE